MVASQLKGMFYMENFFEGYDEFGEMEDIIEEFQREIDQEYVDVFDEDERSDSLELSLSEVLTENWNEIPEENIGLGEKDVSFEKIEPDQRPMSLNHAENALVNEIQEHRTEETGEVEIESVDEGMEQPLIEWKEENEIFEDNLPVSPLFKPINRRDELYNEIGIRTDEEKEAYWDFVSQCMNKEHKLIMDIPLPKNSEFWPPVETDESMSFAFSSMDYGREHPFDKYHWKLKKVFEEVKDLGITYSSLSNEEGKENTHRKYVSLVDKEFGNQAKFLLETYKKHPQWLDKEKTFKRIAELNSEIRKCNGVWDKYSGWE